MRRVGLGRPAQRRSATHIDGARRRVRVNWSVLVVLDAARRMSEAEQSLLKRLSAATVPLWLVLNKVDLIGGATSPKLAAVSAAYHAHLPFAATHAISAAKGDGIAPLKVRADARALLPRASGPGPG